MYAGKTLSAQLMDFLQWTAAAPVLVGETLGGGRVVGQERQPLALHVPATPAGHVMNRLASDETASRGVE